MPTRTDVLALVDTHLARPLPELDPTTPLAEAVFDSFAFVELALGLEQEFGVRMGAGEAAEIATVGDLAAAIEAGMAARGIHSA